MQDITLNFARNTACILNSLFTHQNTHTMSIPQKQLVIDLNGQVKSGTMVSLDFNALPGANPKELGYFVAIWQGDQIQDLKAAKQVQKITTTTQAGSTTFDNLELSNRDYIIGLGVHDESGTSICATLAVPKGVAPFTPLDNSLSSVTLQDQSSDSLIATFDTPVYNLPKTNKNWVALFKGAFTANMYKGTNVVKTTMISDDTNDGAVAMNDIPGGLIRMKQYTLIYGMGIDKSGDPDFSNLVSATEFKIA